MAANANMSALASPLSSRHATALSSKKQWIAMCMRSGKAGSRSTTLTCMAALETPVSRPGRKPGSGSGKKAAREKIPLPEPADYQQTLRRSFVLGGVGAHTGEFAVVRVRPALAGEGRYFVRVPRGTNSSLWQPLKPQPVSEAELAGNPVLEPAQDAQRTRLFLEFLRAEDAGEFSGTFSDWLEQEVGTSDDPFTAAEEALPAEQAEPRQEGEGQYLPASLAAAADPVPWFTALGRPPAKASSLDDDDEEQPSTSDDDAGLYVMGVEHLLAALEASGVDNARIEIEGGPEVPVIDGSAQGWAVEVLKAGLAEAPAPGGRQPRHAFAPQEMITVQEGDAFISFYPGPQSRVTVGVDHSEVAPIIGRQWFSWSPDGAGTNTDGYFQWEVAPARTVYASVAQVEELIEAGLLRGGPEMVSLIGDGTDWFDWQQEQRFPGSEAARHGVIDLLGDLALLARPGGRGLPQGHTVAYRATHELHRKYLDRLAAHASEWE